MEVVRCDETRLEIGPEQLFSSCSRSEGIVEPFHRIGHGRRRRVTSYARQDGTRGITWMVRYAFSNEEGLAQCPPTVRVWACDRRILNP